MARRLDWRRVKGQVRAGVPVANGEVVGGSSSEGKEALAAAKSEDAEDAEEFMK